MKLDDFLKCKKVRCITGDNRKDLTNGKIYDVIGAAYGRLKIHNDNGDNSWYDMDCFELVIESAENPPENMKLTPELVAVEPKFKVGDKVYVGLTGKIAQVTKIIDDDVVNVANKNNEVREWISNICQATQENYEMLCKLYTHIEFEQPPKELKGSEATKHILKENPRQICYVSDQSDFKCRSNDITELAVVVGYYPDSNRFLTDAGETYRYAVPVDGNDNSIEIKV